MKELMKEVAKLGINMVRLAVPILVVVLEIRMFL